MTSDLTREQRARIDFAIRAHDGYTLCTRCGRESYTVGERLIRMPLGDGVSTRVSGEATPIAFVVCNHCGAMYFYSVHKLELEDMLERAM